MNRRQVHKLEGQRVRVRPRARVFTDQGVELPSQDDAWLAEKPGKNVVPIRRLGSDHLVNLRPDQIHDYMTDRTDTSGVQHAFLNLNVQLFIQGKDVWIEPLIGRARKPAHIPVRRPARRPVVIPIAGTPNMTAEAIAIGTLALLLVRALGRD